MSVLMTRSAEMLADSVQNRDDLVQFIQALRADLRDNPDDWENTSLDDYLEAMAAWIDDCDGYYKNTGQPIPKTPSWKMLADILMAAKMYE